jgi:Transposase DDE domain
MARSAPPRSTQINADDRRLALQGSRGLLDEHLRRLRELPAHGNTKLRADQLVLGLLMSFFHLTNRSLRLIEGCGDFNGELNLQRLARSTTSDALAAFDPSHLQPLIEDLRARCPGLHHADADLDTITRRIIAADGTYLTVAADVVWALHHTKINGKKQGQVRANVQLDVASWMPRVVTLSGDDGESEPAAFAKDLLSEVLYVVDRNFVDFGFLSNLLQKGNDFVLRVKANQPSMRVIKSLPLTPRDIQAGVIADEQVELTGGGAPDGIFRLVSIAAADRGAKPQTLRLLSNLTDNDKIAGCVIGHIYRLRWQIELFFKWFKCFARMDHLLSASRTGITTQLYIGVIAVLLMHVQTGRRVSIYALSALSNVARGLITMQQAMQFLAERERERELARARQARRRQRKKLA